MGDTERALGASPPPLRLVSHPSDAPFRSVYGRLPSTQPFALVKVNCAVAHARRDARANWRAG